MGAENHRGIGISIMERRRAMNENDLEQIRTIRSQSLALLGELAASPKLSYTVDNYKLSWNEYHARLVRTVDWCDQKLQRETPFEFRSETTTGGTR